jgi:hypothetical protein
MAIKRDYLFILLNVVSWIIFVGLSIDSGGFVSNTIYTLFFNSNGAAKFWNFLNLSELYTYNQSYFVSVTVLMCIVSVLKAIMFYLIVVLLYNKKINLSNPFNEIFGSSIFNIAYLSLGIGLFSSWGNKIVENIISQGIAMPSIQQLKLEGADIWIFMGITFLVFGKIFKKGIELQTENDLTV